MWAGTRLTLKLNTAMPSIQSWPYPPSVQGVLLPIFNYPVILTFSLVLRAVRDAAAAARNNERFMLCAVVAEQKACAPRAGFVLDYGGCAGIAEQGGHNAVAGAEKAARRIAHQQERFAAGARCD